MTTKHYHSSGNSDNIFPVAKKVWRLLSSNRRRGALRLWCFMVVGMMFELVGVGLVVPVMAILLDPSDLASRSPLFQHYLDMMGNPERLHLVMIVMGTLFSAYLIKNLYLVFLAWQQTRYVYSLQAELSTKLFTTYLRQPYVFHLQRNSALLIRNIQGEMNMLINGIFSPSMQIFAEGLVIIGLGALLLYVAPIGTLIVFLVVGSFARLFQYVTKAALSSWGQLRIFHEGIRIRQLQQGLGGIKDVKLLGRESDFISLYSKSTLQSTQMNQKQSALQQVPRLFLELLAIFGLSILMVTLTWQGESAANIIPTLALFAAVAFRLMPSVNRIMAALQQLRFGYPALNLLYRELNLSNEISKNHTDQSEITFQDEVRLDSISFLYPSAEKPVLEAVSLSIKKGESVGFIGPSGSGKSTLIDILLGLLEPSSGNIHADGVDIRNNMSSWQKQIGYVPQTIFLTDDTLRRNIAFGLAEDQIDNQAVEHALKAAQLESFIKDLPEGINTIVGERGVRLSGGQRQRIGIARALYHNPTVLVLDEATSALDSATESDVIKSINALHGTKTIVMIAHRLSTVEGCDRIYRLENGCIDLAKNANQDFSQFLEETNSLNNSKK